jgi:hypothetical protein
MYRDDVQGEGETLFTGIARVERLAWARQEIEQRKDAVAEDAWSGPGMISMFCDLEVRP